MRIVAPRNLFIELCTRCEARPDSHWENAESL